MRVEIDQSGKIERTNKDTVLCLSNDFWDTVIIKAKTKRYLQEFFRRRGQIRNFVLLTFCSGLAALLRRNNNLNQIIVDREYTGKDSIIKNIVLEMLGFDRKPEIHFALIGKSAKAHDLATKVTHKKEAAKKELSVEEILEEIKSTEVGKRLKNA